MRSSSLIKISLWVLTVRGKEMDQSFECHRMAPIRIEIGSKMDTIAMAISETVDMAELIIRIWMKALQYTDRSTCKWWRKRTLPSFQKSMNPTPQANGQSILTLLPLPIRLILPSRTLKIRLSASSICIRRLSIRSNRQIECSRSINNAPRNCQRRSVALRKQRLPPQAHLR